MLYKVYCIGAFLVIRRRVLKIQTIKTLNYKQDLSIQLNETMGQHETWKMIRSDLSVN